MELILLGFPPRSRRFPVWGFATRAAAAPPTDCAGSHPEETPHWSIVRTALAARRVDGFTCYAVHVDSPRGMPPRQLQVIADKAIGIDDIADHSAAIDVLLSI